MHYLRLEVVQRPSETRIHRVPLLKSLRGQTACKSRSSKSSEAGGQIRERMLSATLSDRRNFTACANSLNGNIIDSPTFGSGSSVMKGVLRIRDTAVAMMGFPLRVAKEYEAQTFGFISMSTNSPVREILNSTWAIPFQLILERSAFAFSCNRGSSIVCNRVPLPPRRGTDLCSTC